MTAAIHYENEAYLVSHEKPMGRHFAGHGFLSAFARYSSVETITGFTRNAKLGEEFCSFVRQWRPKGSSRYITRAQAPALKQIGCLFTPSPINASQAWQRELHGPRAWSLCGVNHTLSSAKAMDGLTDLIAAPVQPWDAIICTSRASRNVIERLFARQEEYLARRLGATRFVRPSLPVIPLGVDCEGHTGMSSQREKARAALGLQPGDFAVLFLGRLSFHAKANPAPMYLALERLAQKHKVALIECGWTANEAIAQALDDARTKLCPSVRSIVLDGRQPQTRMQAWAAADVFCSLSDNIQETFGLTPIEAMATGLPVVVTDWDGYKDTVRHGIDGFAIPTVAPPPGVGRSLADRHAMELDSYDVYIAQAASAVAVDIDATALALETLASNPDLRGRMGANGAARAREVFDWKVIVKAYEALWQELESLRRANADATPASPQPSAGFWPARPDPFDVFAGFPSSALTGRHRLSRVPGIREQDVSERLDLKIALVNASAGTSLEYLLSLWRQLSDDMSVRDLLVAGDRASVPMTVRSLLLLAKFGLVRLSNPIEPQ